MLDLWSMGLFAIFGAAIAAVYAAATGFSARDSRREECVSRLLADQLGADR
jgi:hypothetical protein